jgi:hypothetical protein
MARQATCRLHKSAFKPTCPHNLPCRGSGWQAAPVQGDGGAKRTRCSPTGRLAALLMEKALVCLVRGCSSHKPPPLIHTLRASSSTSYVPLCPLMASCLLLWPLKEGRLLLSTLAPQMKGRRKGRGTRRAFGSRAASRGSRGCRNGVWGRSVWGRRGRVAVALRMRPLDTERSVWPVPVNMPIFRTHVC